MNTRESVDYSRGQESGAEGARSRVDVDAAGGQDKGEDLDAAAVRALASGPRLKAREVAHESARLHVSGEATYTDDIRESAGTLHMAMGLSPKAAGRILRIDLDRIRAQPGVVAVFTAADIPGINDCGPVIHDDPVLADGELRYLGQPVFLVVADEREQARRAAKLAKEVIEIEEATPILGIREGHERQSYVVPPMHLVRESAPGALKRAMQSAPRRLSGSWSLGGQEQFYLEGQVAYALPTEDDTMLVYTSTQHPSEMQLVVAHVLGWASHQVNVQCRRMGGGFGGKESQSAIFAACAALAARQLRRPVKLRVDRDDDFMVCGRRHGYEYDWEVGFDDEGRILALDATLMSNAGHSADLSAAVMTRALCHLDNACFLPEVAIHGFSVKTNTQSNTAFRGFGGPQGALLIEWILDDIARTIGSDALDVHRINFYGIGERDTTPYGQRVKDNVIDKLVGELVESSGYRGRREDVRAFNATSEVMKKGLAMTPVKFGISFNVPHLNQAGALVHVYGDGSVLVNHGGTEMGQGLNTKVAQVVAHAFGLPLGRVRCTATETSKVANTSATAASTGSDLNGMAAQDAAHTIGARLIAFARTQPEFGGTGASTTDSPTASASPSTPPDADVRFEEGSLHIGDRSLPFDELVRRAYLARVQLWSDGFYRTPVVHWDPKTLTGHPFYYYAYGAAVTEVIVDTLSGEWSILRADLLHDAGNPLNEAIDLGQVEGAYIQGNGWLTREELVWHPKTGMLMTHAPSTYKIPTANDLPIEWHTKLWTRPNRSATIHRSKAVGEPPLLLGFSTLLALRDAVAACGPEGCRPPLRAPASSEALLDAVDALQASR